MTLALKHREILLRHPHFFIGLIRHQKELPKEFKKKYDRLFVYKFKEYKSETSWVQQYFKKRYWSKLPPTIQQLQTIPITIEFISEYDKWINWAEYGKIFDLILNDEIFRKHYLKFDWKVLSSFKDHPWTIDLIDQYYNQWNWKALSANNALPWSDFLILRYKNKWDYAEMSRITAIDWDASLIEGLKKKLNWKILCANPSIDWNDQLITRFHTYIRWDSLSSNTNICFEISFVERYIEFIDWYRISSNRSFLWTEEFITKYADKLDWYGLSTNPSVPLNINFIDKHVENWHWLMLTKSENLPWNLEFIHRFEDKIRWKLLINLSQNKAESIWSKCFAHSIDEINVNFILNEIVSNPKKYNITSEYKELVIEEETKHFNALFHNLAIFAKKLKAHK